MVYEDETVANERTDERCNIYSNSFAGFYPALNYTIKSIHVNKLSMCTSHPPTHPQLFMFESVFRVHRYNQLHQQQKQSNLITLMDSRIIMTCIWILSGRGRE